MRHVIRPVTPDEYDAAAARCPPRSGRQLLADAAADAAETVAGLRRTGEGAARLEGLAGAFGEHYAGLVRRSQTLHSGGTWEVLLGGPVRPAPSHDPVRPAPPHDPAVSRAPSAVPLCEAPGQAWPDSDAPLWKPEIGAGFERSAASAADCGARTAAAAAAAAASAAAAAAAAGVVDGCRGPCSSGLCERARFG